MPFELDKDENEQDEDTNTTENEPTTEATDSLELEDDSSGENDAGFIPESGDRETASSVAAVIGDESVVASPNTSNTSAEQLERMRKARAEREDVPPIEQLSPTAKARVEELIDQLEIGPKVEGSTREIEEADAQALVQIANIAMSEDVSVAGLLKEKEIPTAMIWKAADRFDVPLLSPEQQHAKELLEQEFNDLTHNGKPDHMTTKIKRRMAIFRALRRMNREVAGVKKIAEKFEVGGGTPKSWEKKLIRGKDWTELEPELFVILEPEEEVSTTSQDDDEIEQSQNGRVVDALLTQTEASAELQPQSSVKESVASISGITREQIALITAAFQRDTAVIAAGASSKNIEESLRQTAAVIKALGLHANSEALQKRSENDSATTISSPAVTIESADGTRFGIAQSPDRDTLIIHSGPNQPKVTSQPTA